LERGRRISREHAPAFADRAFSGKLCRTSTILVKHVICTCPETNSTYLFRALCNTPRDSHIPTPTTYFPLSTLSQANSKSTADMLELHVWGPAFGLPSLDAHCLAAIAYLQQAVPRGKWQLIASCNPALSPTSTRSAPFPSLGG
jgi:hypothetical protein